MPVSVVVGGQFGSEGKGKIALELARHSIAPVTIVRVGGPNSGHTGYDREGKMYALRQLPAGCIDKNVDVVFPAGSFIDTEVLLDEIAELNFPTNRLHINPFARVITNQHKEWEANANLTSTIGSTGSGVGAAVMAAVAREACNFPLQSVDAEHSAPLQGFLSDTSRLMRSKLNENHRIIIEGTQGFGLSLLDGGFWPKATSRSTTAAGALSEAGLSPLDVDDVTMVIRSYPIRVAGDSGPLPNEINWETIANSINTKNNIQEYTTVTNKIRRVGNFDSTIVKNAISTNAPTRIVMNHLDYIGDKNDLNNKNSSVRKFIHEVENKIEHRIHWLGFSPRSCIPHELVS